ncbi:probable proline--tRNA ligase, mitochondrial isoform X2 [Trichoplusia ni]|uniref:proline--tRNA ligase n=1 Tax=Trichoplusia ni TaxID=7111 RepID=A0A7E5WVC9_TRINI|nr:probable proline--tRNA ligase, mitochondrial isoform X2 [Trichoplusia ni]
MLDEQLLLECGLIRPTSSGLFTILPIARRALNKLESHIIACIEAAGAQRMSLPSLTSSTLWDKTGRLEEVGPELMKMEDRHQKKFLLSPTHEEAVADLLSDVGPMSYKQLPLLLYQIGNKYRDEHRPKHGLLRAREFSMLDAYGLHTSEDCARTMYSRVSDAYAQLFKRLQLPVHRVSAPPGSMGGSMSHEWQLPAAAGEDELATCPRCRQAALDGDQRCETCGGALQWLQSVEVGHTFILGTRYSLPLGAFYTPGTGGPQPILMSCYGIGITRLLAACLEHLSTDKSLRWPKLIAPYDIIIIGPKEGSYEWQSIGSDEMDRLYDVIAHTQPDADIIIDDRHHLTIGKRLVMADRMGYPTIIVIGKAYLESPARYEVYRSTRPDFESGTQTTPYSTPAALLLTEAELLSHLEGNDEQLIKSSA